MDINKNIKNLTKQNKTVPNKFIYYAVPFVLILILALLTAAVLVSPLIFTYFILDMFRKPKTIEKKQTFKPVNNFQP